MIDFKEILTKFQMNEIVVHTLKQLKQNPYKI